MKSRWMIFYEEIQQDFKVFFFVWLLINLLRLAFIVIMSNYIGESASMRDMFAALYYGAKISLKSAGVIMLIAFISATLPNFLSRSQRFSALRLIAGTCYITVLCVLFAARFPFYAEFHTGFNQLIFNTLQDDMIAIYHTVVAQYHFFPRLLLSLISTSAIFLLLRKFLRTGTFLPPRFSTRRNGLLYQGICCVLLVTFAVFVRFGGSLSYARSLHWENASMTTDHFLNEMILDDVQAVYRGYSVKKRIEEGTASGVEQTRIMEYLWDVNEMGAQAATIDDSLLRHASGASIKSPKHIFIILGESYAQWPMMESYAALHLADGIREIVSKPNTARIEAFLPNGAFTPMAANAIISGLSDVNIYPNQQQESYRGIYKTALAPQMKKLGYKTCFWYAGFSAWERIKEFALAQGFDEFYSAADFPYQRGNVWGADDSYLFEAAERYVKDESAPTFHVILTVSNHAPYSVDLSQAGFDANTVREVLPEAARANSDLIKRLGHYWYTDQMIAGFVNTVSGLYPEDSLFMITGDHAERTNIDGNPSLFERSTVPFIVHGSGIRPEMLPARAAGGHVNIGATLIELIAPQGFEYYALGESMTRMGGVGFNHRLWITPDAIGEIEGNRSEALPKDGPAVLEVNSASKSESTGNKQAALEQVRRMRTISWWRTMRGNVVP